MTGAAFEAYVREVLSPTLQPGDIVVLDGLPAHKAAGVTAALQARGARLQLLPPYSPDLNPIELCWAKVKTALRAAKARTEETLLDAFRQALQSITADEAKAWMAHCGYGVHS